MTKPSQSSSEKEIRRAFNAALRNASVVVISSRGKTIRRGGTYPATATVIRNAGRVIIHMDLINGRTSNGTSKNSGRKHLTNFDLDINKHANSRILNYRNY